MTPETLDRYEWHVRRIQIAEGGRMVGEKKLRLMRRERGCKCQIWMPKRSATVAINGAAVKREEVLFPGYVLLGRPGDRWPCGDCALPLMPLEVDIERRALRPSVVQLISQLESEDHGLGEHLVKGQQIKIVNGGLRGFTGEFVALTCSRVPRAVVNVHIFNSIHPIPFSLTQIEVEA